MPKCALMDLISRFWLGKEYNHSDADIVLQALYILLQLNYKDIPYFLIHRFESEVKTSEYPLPAGLVFQNMDVYGNLKTVRPVHSWLIDMLKSASCGNAPGFVKQGIRYLKFVIEKRNEMKVENPWNILWLLEVIAGVIIAMKRNFHDIVLTSSVIYCFLQYQSFLCQCIINWNFEKFDCSSYLWELCQVLRRLWEQKILSLPHKYQKLGAALRVQTILALCCCHMHIKDQDNVWITMREVNDELSKVPSGLDLKRILDASNFGALYLALVEVLECSLEPLVAVRRAGQSFPYSPWFFDGISTKFEIDNTGSIHQWELFHTEDRRLDPKTVQEHQLVVATLKKTEQGLLQDEEDVAVNNEVERSMVRQERAVRILQSWFRRVQINQKRSYGRDHAWDKLYREALCTARNWSDFSQQQGSAARYRMYFLGQVLPRIYEIQCLWQVIDSKIRSFTREISHGLHYKHSELEDHLDQLDHLQDLKNDLDAWLIKLSLENDHHLYADLYFLRKGYEESETIVKRCRAV